MITMAKIRDGSTYLRAHLSANDYYAEGERVIGAWMGQGSQLLEIEGKEVGPGDLCFERLRRNMHPCTGERLTKRTAASRTSFFDFQISAPKSVSILAVTFADERLRRAHEEAVCEAYTQMEKFAARRVRDGQDAWSEKTQITGNLCSSIFHHDSSRALDPQLHAHAVTANATFDSDAGQWFSLTEAEIFKAIRYAGKCYQSALAKRVLMSGYRIENERDESGLIIGFQIVGVTAADRAIASTRRAQIDQGISNFERDHGRKPTKREINVIVRQTRGGKLLEITTEEVRRRQMESHSPERQAALKAVVAESRSRGPIFVDGDAGRALGLARDHLFERDSVVSAHQLLAEALNQSLGAIDTENLQTILFREEEGLCLLEPAENPLSAIFGTRAGLEQELRAIQFVNAGAGQCRPAGGGDFQLPAKLSPTQVDCVVSVLESHDRVMAIRGVAGAGKTTVLSVIHHGMEAGGTRAFFCAPTTAAAKVLRSEGFSNATTLTDFLLSAERRHTGQLAHAVIFVDESGLISNAQGIALLDLARRTGARVLLIGDTRQHHGVDAGDFLGLLEKHSVLRSSALTEIRRQLVQSYRAAVKKMACGRAREGLIALQAQACLVSSGEDYVRNAAADYLRHVDGQVLVVAPTWDEIHALTNEIRRLRKAKGELPDERDTWVFDPQKWTRPHKADASSYGVGHFLSVHTASAKADLAAGNLLEVVDTAGGGRLIVTDLSGRRKTVDPMRDSCCWEVGVKRFIRLAIGDRVLIRQNSKAHDLTNGEVLSVLRFDEHGGWVGADADGRPRAVPSGFRVYAHGYATTSHQAQGRTADHVIVCAAKLDGKATYVAFSRGRYSARCYCPDSEALIDGVPQQIEGRSSAIDVLKRKRTVMRRTRALTWSLIFNMRSVVRRVGRIAANQMRLSHAGGRSH